MGWDGKVMARFLHSLHRHSRVVITVIVTATVIVTVMATIIDTVPVVEMYKTSTVHSQGSRHASSSLTLLGRAFRS